MKSKPVFDGQPGSCQDDNPKPAKKSRKSCKFMIFPEAISSVLLPKPNQVTPPLCHSKETTCTDLARVSQNCDYLLALTAVQVCLWQSFCKIY